MRIAITMPDELYEKLESDRGLIPRATYIQLLIGQGLGSSVSSGKVPMQSHGDSLGHGSSLSSAKKVSPRVKKGSSRPKADTGKKGLPMQDVGGLKTYFKK